jgi:hypothetical protein
MNLQENILRIREMMGMDNSRHTFNIQKLVDDNIIFITMPGDGQGGIAEPNWEGDCSVITLDNLTNKEIELNPWRLEAIKQPYLIVFHLYKIVKVIGVMKNIIK